MPDYLKTVFQPTVIILLRKPVIAPVFRHQNILPIDINDQGKLRQITVIQPIAGNTLLLCLFLQDPVNLLKTVIEHDEFGIRHAGKLKQFSTFVKILA
jgi:hypothetical protein